jgi:CO/xanthine dehydrogenase Mo-binding subunit
VADQPFLVFTALLAKRCGGRPVLYRMSRREDFHDTRSPVLYQVKAGAKADGTIVAWDSKAYGNAGAYADDTMGAVEAVIEEFAELSLAPIPNVHLDGCAVYTNTVPGGVKRGIGNNEINLAWGRLLDELGERLGMDPLEVALKNCGHAWGPVPDPGLEAVLKAGAEHIGWERRGRPPEDPLAGPVKKRGLGFSIHNTWHAGWQEVPRGRVQVRLKLNPDGSVVLDAPTAETGTGSSSCAVFACADALEFLGVTPDDIAYIAQTDTERGLKEMVQTDSAVAYLHAEVMPKAGAELKAKLIGLLVRLLDTPAEGISIDAGRVTWAGGPAAGRPVRDILMERSDLVPLVVDVEDLPPAEVTGCPFLATFAEVEVDTETGSVEVIALVQVNDCGKVMYRAGAESQLIGGQAMAMSETLFEEIVYDERTGLPLDFDWVDYRMATLADAPRVDPVLLEVWKGAGTYPAAGIGEGVTTATPCAIANAVYNAVGVRLYDLPITPQKVLRALGRID